jgi:hypothetical protein
MKLRDCRLDRIAYLTLFPVSFSFPFLRRNMPESMTITIVQRLAYLIVWIETSEGYSNALGSKWYLQHLMEVFLPGSLQEITEPFVARLQHDVQSYERRMG